MTSPPRGGRGRDPTTLESALRSSVGTFEFGRNWRRFLKDLNEERIQKAEASLRDMLAVEDLTGRRFLDAGCGSGLFSLAARRLGAAVRSFDIDPVSVACAAELRRRYFPADPSWIVETGSVLDMSYLRSLDACDVVYSWGVLHHTGALWQGLENILIPLSPGRGLLFIAIYNDQGRASRRWAAVKRLYNVLPAVCRPCLLLPAVIRLWGPTMLRDILSGKPGHTWRHYDSHRGMSPWRDLVDWVGEYPYETAKPDEVLDFYRRHGLAPRRLVPSRGLGCNEYVFERMNAR